MLVVSSIWMGEQIHVLCSSLRISASPATLTLAPHLSGSGGGRGGGGGGGGGGVEVVVVVVVVVAAAAAADGSALSKTAAAENKPC